jgi:DNA polymerase-3 subunit beta
VADARAHRGQFPKFDELRPKEFTLRGDDRARGAPRGRPPHVGDGAPQLAAAAALREGEVTVWTQTQDVGEARETLPVRFDGEPLEIGFNASSS